MQLFSTWHRRYGPRGLVVVGLSDEPPSVIERFARQMQVPYTLATDAGSRTAGRYAVSAIPTMFVMDRGGIIRRVSVGLDLQEAHAVEALIEVLLAEPDPCVPSSAGSP